MKAEFLETGDWGMQGEIVDIPEDASGKLHRWNGDYVLSDGRSVPPSAVSLQFDPELIEARPPVKRAKAIAAAIVFGVLLAGCGNWRASKAGRVVSAAAACAPEVAACAYSCVKRKLAETLPDACANPALP